MKSSDKLEMVKTILNLTGTDEDGRIGVYLIAAAREILSWRFSYAGSYPSFTERDGVPVEYEMTQVFAVIAGYSQSGAENQTAHSENGISRTFKYEDMVAYIRRHVIPMAGVMGGSGMRTLNRNKSEYWYLLYDHKEPILDEDGNETGDYRVFYREAVKCRDNISPATGASQIEQFGNLSDYDKVIVTEDSACPMDENTVLFVDKEPEYDEEGQPLYDYTVRRVARSLNSASYAISKVSVS